MIFNKKNIRNFLFIFFVFFICLISFVFYKNQEFLKDINFFISKINKDNNFLRISENQKISFFRNPFSNSIKIKNLDIKILNFDYLDFKLKECNFENLIIKKISNNNFIIFPDGLIEIIGLQDKNIVKFFLNLKSSFEIKFKNNYFENFLDKISYFEYKDRDLIVFDHNKKIIFSTELHNNIKISSNLDKEKDQKNTNLFINISNNKVFPFNLFMDIEENLFIKDKILLNKIRNIRLNLLDSTINVNGEIISNKGVEDYLMNADENDFDFVKKEFFSESGKYFIKSDVKIKIENFEKLLNSIFSFLSLDQINLINSFINDFGVKNNNKLEFFFEKELGKRAKLNEKEFSGDILNEL